MTKANIGLDFGTTNTLLYYFDEGDGEGGKPAAFDASGQNALGVIPSLVERRRRAGRATSRIGALAQKLFDKEKVEIARNFKLALSQVGPLKEDRRKNADFNAAADFLRALFEDFHKSSDFSSIGSVVVTAPEEWLSSPNQYGPNAIRHIFQELNLPAPRFVSEPVAACAYFTHKYRAETKSPFDGFGVVYDHGGGTLDLSFVKIQDQRVRPIVGSGMSMMGKGEVFGGAAFDVALFEHLGTRHRALRKLKDPERQRAIDAIECVKRDMAPQIESLFREGASGATDTLLAEVEVDRQCFDMTVGDLLGVFEKQHAPKIRERFGDFLRHAKAERPQADFSSGENCRVIRVGGFSSFAPVEHLVRSTCLTKFDSSAALFKDMLEPKERWSATAMGACLIAQGRVHVEDVFPFIFGIVTYSSSGAREDVLIFDRQNPIADYARGKELRGKFRLWDQAASFEFYLYQDDRRISVRTDRRMRDLLPDVGRAKYWQITALFQEGVAYLRFESDLKHTKKVRLGQIVDLAEQSIEILALDE